MNRESKLLVVLFSDPNFLAVNLLEILLSRNCIVNIISDDKSDWDEKTKHLTSISRFSIIGLEDYKDLANFSYTVFCGGFLKKENTTTDFKKFISNKNFGNAKTLAIFPFEIFSSKVSSKIAISDNAGIIYMGDLMGPRIDLDSNLLLPSLINEMVTQRSVTLAIGEFFYPVFVADAAKVIVRWLLSFGPYGKETFLLGRQVSSSDFWKQNMRSFPDLRVLYNTEIEPRFIPKGYETVVLNSNLNICLNETYKWLIRENLTTKSLKTKKSGKVKIKKPSKLKFLKPYIIFIFLILFFPLITTLVSAGALFLSYKQFLSENTKSAQNSALFAKAIFVIGRGESDALSYIPVLGRVYKETSYISYAGETLSDLAVNVIPVAESGHQILAGILGTGIFDVKSPSLQIKSGLDYVYQRMSFFLMQTQDKAGLGVLSAKQALQLVDFDKLKILIQEGSVLIGDLPTILGEGVNKNYLVLFENNMELRPTGGFIGSYGIANFGGGKLNGLSINDIYSADGQLKGHIEPPLPIKNYLGEANWWFRDSNWNPDFPTSAERAEWFLNKEMGQQVDGVVSVDLEPIKNILSYTGPIFLPDYNLTITHDNLYEKTQGEVQANTFAGSRQKASFLTALSRSLIAEIPKMNSKERLLVLKAVYESLVGRHVQIYLHDQNPAESIDKLGWDGKVQSYSCGESCYSDFFGDVEANVGVNKSNYFVRRKINFNVSIDTQKVTRILTINLENSANPALGASGIYKSYLRVIIPQDAKVLGVKALSGQNTSNILPEITQEKNRQEVGVLVEITPGQSKDIEFTWQSDQPKDTAIKSYGLFVRKQAGVDADPLGIQFKGPGGVESRPVFTLTKEGSYTYNTVLTKDFFARISWH